MSFLSKLINCLTCCMGTKIFNIMLDKMKFRKWNLRNQMMGGVACSMLLVLIVLVLIVNLLLEQLVENTTD